MARTRQQSAKILKPKSPNKGGRTPKTKNVQMKRKRKARAKKKKVDMQYAVSNLEKVKDNFITSRKFSVSDMKMANNIQITCTTDNTQPSTSQISDDKDDNKVDKNDLNLSLASYGKKQIKKKLSFARKMVKANQSDEIICLDDTCNGDTLPLNLKPETIKASETSTMVDDSLIVIDDDSVSDVIELSETIDEIVDLTNLSTLHDTSVHAPNQLVQVWNIANPLEQQDSYDTPTPLQQLFPPIPFLQQPYVSFQPPSTNFGTSTELFGTNFMNAGTVRTSGLRPIFIDGNNIAIGHSNGKFFSVKGLKICIDYFKLRGHEVTAIVPQFRKKKNQNSDQNLLLQLENQNSVVFTPSRRINGRSIVPYDDRFIVQLAAVHLGVIVSCDNFKDLLLENPNLRETIENRVLNPTWVKDMIIFPSDPLGRWGPRLDEFLRFP